MNALSAVTLPLLLASLLTSSSIAIYPVAAKADRLPEEHKVGSSESRGGFGDILLGQSITEFLNNHPDASGPGVPGEPWYPCWMCYYWDTSGAYPVRITITVYGYAYDNQQGVEALSVNYDVLHAWGWEEVSDYRATYIKSTVEKMRVRYPKDDGYFRADGDSVSGTMSFAVGDMGDSMLVCWSPSNLDVLCIPPAYYCPY
jgi:hypothetical protein